MRHYRAVIFTTSKANKKKTTPSESAIAVMRSTNLSSYVLSGVLATPPVAAKSAICPIIVLEEILITMPLPLPSLHIVPKKAKFLVSKGYSG